jgi:hypothetical protein
MSASLAVVEKSEPLDPDCRLAADPAPEVATAEASETTECEIEVEDEVEDAVAATVTGKVRGPADDSDAEAGDHQDAEPVAQQDAA